jgi:hypothetical protein
MGGDSRHFAVQSRHWLPSALCTTFVWLLSMGLLGPSTVVGSYRREVRAGARLVVLPGGRKRRAYLPVHQQEGIPVAQFR